MLKILLGKPAQRPLQVQSAMRRCVLGAGLLLAGLGAQAQALSGAYTINSALPTGGTNFASFAAAASRLSFSGVSGPVTIAVTGGPYTEQFALGVISGTSATNTVVVNGGGSTIQFGSNDTNQRGVVILNGSDYVTINNLVINATGGAYGYGIHLYGNADNNTITNNTVNADLTSTLVNFAGIVVSGSASSITASGDAGSNTLIQGNTVSGGYYGIAVTGNSTTLSQGNVVRSNQVRDFYTYGITVSAQDGAQVVSNDVSRPLRTSPGSFYGVYGFSSSRNLNIAKNRVHDDFTGQATPSTAFSYGIFLATGTGATATSPNSVVNNVIYNMNGNSGQYLLYNSGSTYCRLYNNSISSNNQTSTSTAATYGIYTSGANTDIRNNVMSITRTGTGTRYAIYTLTNVPTSSNNDLYVPGGVIGYANSAAYPVLANWQAAGFDQNSLVADPLYTSASTGNLLPANPQLNNAGIALASVTDDITGATRGAVPDMGAYEFTPVATDLAPVALAGPAATSACYGTTEAVSVLVRNAGGATLDFAANPAAVTVVATPPTGTPQTFTTTLSTGTLASGATQTIALPGSLNMAALGTYRFAVTATVTGDLNTGNDVLTPATTRTVAAVVAGTLSPAATSICISGTTQLALADAANGTLQWQSSSSATGPFADVAGATSAAFTTPVLTSTTYYRVRVGCNTNVTYSNVSTVTVSNPQVATTNTPLTVCAGATATLTATANAGSTVRFYTTATGGTALATTTAGSYTTPALTASTTYYAGAVTGGQENVGKAATNGIDGTNATGGLFFLAAGPVTITNVTAYRAPNAAAGSATVYLIPGNPTTVSTGTALASATLTVPANTSSVAAPTVLTLNFAVPAAGQYTLYLGASSPALVRDLSTSTPATTYPYTSPSGAVTITGTTLGTSYYYFFYNWQLGVDCPSPTRTPIQVNVTTVPATLTASTPTTGGILLTAAPVAGATYQFFLNGTAVGAASTTNTLLVASAAQHGTYTVVVTSGGCTSAPSAPLVVTSTATRTASLNGVSLLVYPNPTPDGRLTLELTGPQAKASQLEVLNALGQAVQRRNLAPGTAQLSLAGLAAGVYTLRVHTEQGVLTQRVVRE
ncbi:MAG TPA: T9SS type A sorting domain-containing protein [Hymenobacter sp.]|uniref:Ig-like domain-containing protein n=1 Tax=Hymenobacter sp. TaxID=1898978 RepID=UPI002D7E6F48|nr:T9SS type A sorting domain-containing protein [Hymenobacter sp.]HET9505548.1 T9SS type A sorting domain-containing protein [Hymenobacter sp.]